MKRITLETRRIAKVISTKPSILVYDCETTGLKHLEDRVIQFSGALISFKSETGKYGIDHISNILINPGFPISSTIENLTGITNAILQEKGIPEAEAFRDIKAEFESAEAICGYNVGFDNDFINDMAMRYGTPNLIRGKSIIDAIAPARELIPKTDVHSVVNKKDHYHTLENVSKYYGVGIQGYHQADVDVRNTIRVLFAEMRDLKTEKIEHTVTYDITAMTRWQKSKEQDKIFVDMVSYSGSELNVEYDVYEHRFNTDGNYDANDIYEQMLEARTSQRKKSWSSFKEWRKN